MTDTVFRTIQEAPKLSDTNQEIDKSTEQTSGGIINEDVPYSDYENINLKPFSVDYFNLGDHWQDPVGGFPKEIAALEEYVKSKVDTGEIANSQSAVKELIKGLEKITNLKNEERTVIKMGTLSAYVEFLMKVDGIKANLRRYART